MLYTIGLKFYLTYTHKKSIIKITALEIKRKVENLMRRRFYISRLIVRKDIVLSITSDSFGIEVTFEPEGKYFTAQGIGSKLEEDQLLFEETADEVYVSVFTKPQSTSELFRRRKRGVIKGTVPLANKVILVKEGVTLEWNPEDESLRLVRWVKGKREDSEYKTTPRIIHLGENVTIKTTEGKETII